MHACLEKFLMHLPHLFSVAYSPVAFEVCLMWTKKIVWIRSDDTNIGRERLMHAQGVDLLVAGSGKESSVALEQNEKTSSLGKRASQMHTDLERSSHLLMVKIGELTDSQYQIKGNTLNNLHAPVPSLKPLYKNMHLYVLCTYSEGISVDRFPRSNWHYKN
jgi:hypothetical protein